MLENTTTTREMKRMLPLSLVCAHLGIALDHSARGHCPFHPDTNPSFYLWVGDDEVERYTCHPCGASGDLFDLIMRVRGVDFSEAYDLVEEMIFAKPPDFKPLPAPPRVPLDMGLVNSARTYAYTVPGMMATLTGLATDETLAIAWDEYLRHTWGWGVSAAGTIFQPHFSPVGVLTGAKIRRGQSKKSMPGSRFDYLYGAWLPRQHEDVLLCEGETDTVFAAAQGADVDVYGLPRGAESRALESWVEFTDPGILHLAFDGDDAGRRATDAWLRATKFQYVKVCKIPNGRDVRSAGITVEQLLAEAS